MLLTLEDERDIPGVWAVGSQQERPLGASINRIGFGVCYTKVFVSPYINHLGFEFGDLGLTWLAVISSRSFSSRMFAK